MPINLNVGAIKFKNPDPEAEEKYIVLDTLNQQVETDVNNIKRDLDNYKDNIKSDINDYYTNDIKPQIEQIRQCIMITVTFSGDRKSWSCADVTSNMQVIHSSVSDFSKLNSDLTVETGDGEITISGLLKNPEEDSVNITLFLLDTKESTATAPTTTTTTD